MKIQEIPAKEQLMGLTSEPSAAPNMQFFLKGLIWPSAEALESRTDTTAQTNGDLLDDTVVWIERVLRPAFVAPDIRARLRAARSIVGDQDAFLARYRIDQTSIQIVVTQFHLHVVIAPMGTSPFAAVNHYLQIDEPDEKHQWNLSLQTGQIGDLQFGYQPRASLADWRESLFYLTDGEAIKFSIKKVTPRSGGTGRIKGFVVPTEEAESHWFTSAGTGPQH